MSDLHDAERSVRASESLDYWSFVDLARTRLTELTGGEDAQATVLILSLNRASSLITYDLDSSIHRPRGWSWPAYRLMFVLWLAGPMESKTAAGLTGESRASTSNLTRTLVAMGYLEKEPHSTDGRSVILSLTPSGSAEIMAAFEAEHRQELRWASVLSDSEQKTLIDLLTKLASGRDSIANRVRA